MTKLEELKAVFDAAIVAADKTEDALCQARTDHEDAEEEVYFARKAYDKEWEKKHG